MSRRRGAAAIGAMLLCAAGLTPTAQAASLRYCDSPQVLSATQQDRLLRFAAIARRELQDSGAAVALVARSGLDLSRFDQRYSHAGIALRDSTHTPWSVRQLYYACDERRPRLYDQGLPGFVIGTDDPGLGFVSMVLLPATAATALRARALDDGLALALLGSSYSANAYPFNALHQNCNQWVVEMLAIAWSGNEASIESTRQRAQAWLLEQHYEPAVFAVGNRLLMWLASALPWLYEDDHPPEDLAQARYRVSMPTSIEAFVRAAVPGAERIELCHDGRRVVVHRGWEPIAAGCVPGEQDRVVVLE